MIIGYTEGMIGRIIVEHTNMWHILSVIPADESGVNNKVYIYDPVVSDPNPRMHIRTSVIFKEH